MEKVTKKLSHLQNLTTVYIYKKYCKNIIFISYGQVVDES
ncbi:hypothetical protein VXG46_002614 [Acinetobacter baumannii]|uniref:Uncharacterized protein n=1 Tax=Acinetobacter baumannii TaxID=470 RepID=A0A505MM86_ACIBA|nr:hypothetical protein [Acinetobacter baumannii]EHU1524251.1 hypothetical protein [Acinetobacter baumannii]EHU1536438.1 hypothetical protein [Acinetobacter baumannii]EHU2000765.1 hypothetical protein [Acinetobacter baumannii]EJB8495827.1 hypothetical protein [Acinetobacter baumannii]EKW4078656.1 hypothetical protein [Acinetobacter baumannii]